MESETTDRKAQENVINVTQLNEQAAAVSAELSQVDAIAGRIELHHLTSIKENYVPT